MRVRAERIHQRVRHLRDRRLLVQEPLLFGVGDKAHLEQYRRTSGLEQHPECRLTNTSILAVQMPYEPLLHLLGEQQRLLHVAVLHQLEHYIRVDRVGVKTRIGRFVVGL